MSRISRKPIETLLEECLQAYDAGLAPEECLEAFPSARAELEPLFRQALSLRVAYAQAPSDDFKREARERFLFAAGRDVSAAFAGEPEAEFKLDARRRLIYAAGAAAQDALRDVPPPRLPFWINARRRLLEAATVTPMPSRAPAFAIGLSLRTGLSAAVVVLALTIAGLTYIGTNGPRSVDAEYNALNAQIQDVQDQLDNGQQVKSEVIVDLSRRTSELAAKLTETESSPIAAKLPELIDRQRDVVAIVSSSGPLDPALEQATKQLNEADIRLAATRLDQETPVPGEPTEDASATEGPSASATLAPTARPQPVAKGQVLLTALTNDKTLGLEWTEARSSNLRLVFPSAWKVTRGEPGETVITATSIRIDSPESPPRTIILVDMKTGEIIALVNGHPLILRDGEADGKKISADDLIAALGEDATDTITMFHIVESITVSGELAP
ncbi:MAG TPA: hypothetical protein VI759_06170 [Dehalococcoidia bacterium]|nr:hypothetical protein [Dehalococcoidia bacterium]